MGVHSDVTGFTLVELTVTIVVIGILAAIAIPRFVSGDAFSSRSFFDESKSIVRYAQKVAIAQRRLVYVNVTATRVELCYAAAAPCAAASRVPSPVDPADPQGAHTDSTEARWKLDPGRVSMSMSMSAANLSFDGLGQPYDAPGHLTSADVVISFTSIVPDDPARAITVVSQTGYVY